MSVLFSCDSKTLHILKLCLAIKKLMEFTCICVINPLNLKNDEDLISPLSYTLKSFIYIMRIKEMINKL